MRIARFTVDNELYFGLVEGEAGNETLRVLAGDPFYNGVEPTGKTYTMEQVRLLAPIIPRSKVIGVTPNNTGSTELASQFFIKPNTTVVGPGDPVTIPEYADQLTCRGELAVVIGRIAKSVPLERVHEIIFGYTIANDLSAAVADADAQWTRATCFDGSTPLGPWMITDIDANSLSIAVYADNPDADTHTTNDPEAQPEEAMGSTAQLPYSVAEVVAAASEIFTLLPGDVILVGVPTEQRVLGAGAQVEVELEDTNTHQSLGTLMTRIRHS